MNTDPKTDTLWKTYLVYILVLIFGIAIIAKIIVVQTKDSKELEKLAKKHTDFICANSIAKSQTGFAVDTNQVTLITQAGVVNLPLCSKEETANLILDHINSL